MSSVKLACTKKLAGILNKNNSICNIEIEKMTIPNYRMYADNGRDNYSDYNINTGPYSVIVVYYPAEYYAMPRYITGSELREIAKEFNCKTVDEFCAAFNDYVEI